MKSVLFYLSLLVAIGLIGATVIIGEVIAREGLQRSQTEEANPLQVLTVSDPVALEPSQHERDPLDQGADNCPATVIPELPYIDTGTTAGRANNWNTAGSCAGGGGDSNAPDVIYSLIPYFPGQEVVISTCGSAFNTLLEVRTNGACPGTTQIACADAGCGGDAELRIVLPTENTYYIILDGWGTQSGNYTLTVRQMCSLVMQGDDFGECPETVDSSHARLDCDGGPCNVAFGGTATYTPLACGQSIFGKGFTYARAGATYMDTDWYRFTVTELCTVRITAEAEFPSILSAGWILASCIDHAYVFSGFTCIPSVLTVPNVTPGDYEISFRPWDANGIPEPRDYRITLDCIPVSGCVIDATLNAPGTVTGNTAGAGNDCSYESTNDRTIRVNIPASGAWEFSLCGGNPGWEPVIYLKGSCCSDPGGVIEWSNHGCETVDWLPVIKCRNLDAGTYYLTVEGRSGSEFNSGPFTLSVDMCTGCVLDGMIYAPGTFNGNTCGAGRDCLAPGPEDQMLRIVIPETDDWNFRIPETNFNAYMSVFDDCCSDWISAWFDIRCLKLNAGVYYLWVRSVDSLDCGTYTVVVDRCRERCCYGDEYQLCADTTRTFCEAMGGILDFDRACSENPCPFIPPCPDSSMYSQPPRGSDVSLSGRTSDLNSNYQIFDNFEGVTGPINQVRFFGMTRYILTPCMENPLPIRVVFREGDYPPGDIVATYEDTLVGAVAEVYAPGDTLFEYNLVLNPPVILGEGWIGIMGEGDPACDFFWKSSGIGDHIYCEQFGPEDSTLGGVGGVDLAFCLGGCPPADSVVLKHNSGIHFTLSFWAPVDAEYLLYYTAQTNVEFPTGFMLASSPDLAAGHHDINLNLSSTYQRWLIVTNCE